MDCRAKRSKIRSEWESHDITHKIVWMGKREEKRKILLLSLFFFARILTLFQALLLCTRKMLLLCCVESRVRLAADKSRKQNILFIFCVYIALSKTSPIMPIIKTYVWIEASCHVERKNAFYIKKIHRYFRKKGEKNL